MTNYTKAEQAAYLQGAKDMREACALAANADPGDFGGTDDKLVREQWWGREIARREVLSRADAFISKLQKLAPKETI